MDADHRLPPGRVKELTRLVGQLKAGQQGLYEQGLATLFSQFPLDPRIAHRMTRFLIGGRRYEEARDVAKAALEVEQTPYLLYDLVDIAGLINDEALFRAVHPRFQAICDAGFRDFNEARVEAARTRFVLAMQLAEWDAWLMNGRSRLDGAERQNLARVVDRLARVAAITTDQLGDMVEALIGADMDDLALGLCGVVEDVRGDLRPRRRAMLTLRSKGRSEPLFAHLLAVLQQGPAIETMPARSMRNLADMLRMAIALTTPDPERLAPHQAAVLDRNPPSPFRSWVLGALELAAFNDHHAIEHFEEGLELGAMPNGLDLDLKAEVALVHLRHNRFAEARERLSHCGAGLSQTYARRLAPIEQITAFVGEGREVAYPEGLIDIILDEVARDPIAYESKPGAVAWVASSLAQGGSERQMAVALPALARDSRINSASLFVRSVDPVKGHDYFLPGLADAPIDLQVYGRDWTTPTDLAGALEPIAARPRLREAIDLLPRNDREDLLRIARLLLERRPSAVHIRQDLYVAALAAAMVGAPRFLVHRGSLAPTFWRFNRRQADVHLRPMRHTYRRLIERRPDFQIVNNSNEGARTDRDWLEWEDPTPFKVIHNAIDFDLLGPACGPNWELRRDLGLPENAFLIGGAFRIIPVKRPLLWMETARRVLMARPDAWFLILGDGEMKDVVEAYAREYGFADRLRLAGRVSDVGPWFRAMDLTLLTSDREGLPNAVIEGQHFGAPAVVTDVGGASEALEAGVTGHLVPVDAGAEAFAERILEIMEDAAWRARARARGPEFVHDKFSLPRVIDEIVACYALN